MTNPHVSGSDEWCAHQYLRLMVAMSEKLAGMTDREERHRQARKLHDYALSVCSDYLSLERTTEE